DLQDQEHSEADDAGRRYETYPAGEENIENDQQDRRRSAGQRAWAAQMLSVVDERLAGTTNARIDQTHRTTNHPQPYEEREGCRTIILAGNGRKPVGVPGERNA